MKHKLSVLHWWGCDYQRTSKRGWYWKGQYIGRNVFEAGKWLCDRDIAYIKWIKNGTLAN